MNQAVGTRIYEHEYKWLRGCDSLSRIFSTCSKRQYFSVIIGQNKRLLSQGYNGSPPGYPHCNEGFCPRAIENSASGSNYDNCIANHAEANALLWCDPHAREGATLIINGTPCFACAKLIASSGISRVVGYNDPTYVQIDLVKSFLFANKVDLVLIERTSGPPENLDKEKNAYMAEYIRKTAHPGTMTIWENGMYNTSTSSKTYYGS